ncbi:filament-plant-like protein, partial [Trifolium pratense]
MRRARETLHEWLRLESSDEEQQQYTRQKCKSELYLEEASNQQITTSDGWHEDPESPVESSADSTSDHFHVRRVRSSVKFESHKSETISELMDDFLEVEKMASSSDNDSVQIADKVKNDSEDKQLKSNDALVEIQLKCMTESYKSLQTHVEELEAENKFLKEKIDE